MSLAAVIPFGRPSMAAFAATFGGQSTSDDDNAMKFADQLEEVMGELRQAEEECERCNQTYETLRPERPQSLLWRAGDPVGHSNEKYKIGDQWFYWCNFENIIKLQNRTHEEWLFVGTDQEAKHLCIPNGPHGTIIPVIGKEHLFKAYRSERKEQRAAELLSSLLAYRAADEEARVASGADEADALCDDLYEKKWDLIVALGELKPSSVAGVKSLARAYVVGHWNGQVDQDDDAETKMLSQLLKGLLNLPLG